MFIQQSSKKRAISLRNMLAAWGTLLILLYDCLGDYAYMSNRRLLY